MNITKWIAGVAIIAACLTSCKKYPEGPAISLRSKTARVANTWKVEQYTVNGVDYTSQLTNSGYIETYDKDGIYSYSNNLISGSGKWEFANGKEEIKRSGVSGQSSENLVILKLKENAFWYYYMNGNDKHEFHFESN